MANKILVLDDQKSIRQDLEKFLSQQGFTVYTAGTIEKATNKIQTEKVDFALIDLKIDFRHEYGGKEVIRELNKRQPQAGIIIVTAYEQDDELKKELSDVEYVGFVYKGGKQNFIEAVIETLKNAKKQPEPKKCFVIMPFSSTQKCNADQWNEVYMNTIECAVKTSGFNYKCYKIDLNIGNIIVGILENLYNADVVIADLTDRNPNVYYELGVRHALKDSTLLITQSLDDVPFDLRHNAVIVYDWKTKNGRKVFCKKVKNALQEIENGGRYTVSPVREYLGLTK